MWRRSRAMPGTRQHLNLAHPDGQANPRHATSCHQLQYEIQDIILDFCYSGGQTATSTKGGDTIS